MISVVIPVYRDVLNAVELVEALSHQQLPNDCSLEIIVVDDGSNDGTANMLKRHESESLHIVVLKDNVGRATARNVGAEIAQGKYLAFIDCDCRPVCEDFLATHIQTLNHDSVAACGPVTGNGSDFWARYQDDASLRRQQQHSRGAIYCGSTQNFAVHRQAFIQLGGFDARYREYGFEDRDLFVRLSRLGNIGWSTDAVVRHFDRLTLPNVLAKMQQAAGSSAILFSRDHPEAYMMLGYSAIDARLHRWLRPFGMALGPLLDHVASIDWMLNKSWMPYPIAKAIVKALGGLAFVQGSANTDRQSVSHG